jgi:hypothetical protein
MKRENPRRLPGAIATGSSRRIGAAIVALLVSEEPGDVIKQTIDADGGIHV